MVNQSDARTNTKPTSSWTAAGVAPGAAECLAANGEAPSASALAPTVLGLREPLVPITPLLRTFYEPQMEQLGMQPAAKAGGVVAKGMNHYGNGELWAQQLGESCLVIAHSVTLFSDFALEEESPRSLCVASITADGIPFCPVRSVPQKLCRSENIVVFEQGSRTISHLRSGDQLNSVAVCVLPAYFDELRQRYGATAAQHAYMLMSAPGSVRMGGSEPYVRAMLRLLGSVRSESLSVRRTLARKVDGMVALLALENHEAQRAFDLQGCASSTRAVAQVRCLVEADPAHAPTVDQLAQFVGVSRARLCATFKQETGESVGAYITRKRMELACHLLEDAHLTIATVAKTCGYQHQSSFADAFHRFTGNTPRAWREHASIV